MLLFRNERIVQQCAKALSRCQKLILMCLKYQKVTTSNRKYIGIKKFEIMG